MAYAISDFGKVERFVARLAEQYGCRHGLERDEAHAVARLGYVLAVKKCYDTLPPNRQLTFLYYTVRQQLADALKREAVRKAHWRRFGLWESGIGVVREVETEDRTADARGLSEDAQTMIRVALSGNHGRADGCALRKHLFEFLGDLGWSVCRIWEAFDEVRRAL